MNARLPAEMLLGRTRGVALANYRTALASLERATAHPFARE